MDKISDEKKVSGTVLVIDDSPMEQKILRIYLEKGEMCCLVLTADNGKHGVDMAIKERPDIIILDLEMPVMDGIEALTHLKNNDDTKDIPVLMFTSVGEFDIRERCFSLGAKGFLNKPHGIKEITDMVRELLTVQ